MTEYNLGANSGSREPSPSVSALTGFDPGRCPKCHGTGYEDWTYWGLWPCLHCKCCGTPIDTCELCEKCAEGNDPFFTSKYSYGARGPY